MLFLFIVCACYDCPDISLTVALAQYPYRSVQIVLRLYSSPAEIVAGFDIDACCACYDGK